MQYILPLSDYCTVMEARKEEEEEEDYIPMNDEPSTVVLNCITEAVVICVVIM